MAKRQPDAAVPAGLPELYLGAFDDFVARRNELAKSLRAKGDTDAADAVRGAKKPSRVAWALNQLSHDRPKVRDELLAAGEQLRSAQQRLISGEGDTADARTAGERERAAVGEGLRAAQEVAQGDDAGLSSAAVERARQTLHAIALDDDVRHQFERHCLTSDHQAASLGPFDAAPAKASGSRDTESSARGRGRGRDEARAAKHRSALKAAESDARKLRNREDEARRAVDGARDRAEKAQRGLERATADLEEASVRAEAASAEVRRLQEHDG